MILGISVSAFTTFHVVLSLIGIVAGLIVVAGLLRSKALIGWTGLFLATTVVTSVTGFFFPRDQILPSHVVGIISLLLIAVAIAALYGYHLAHAWRWIYVVAAMVSLYLNVFVLVVQSFQKVGFLTALAPTQSSPTFIVAQVIVLAIFVALGFAALRSFRFEGNRSELGAV
jgi:hypothetical protein